MAKKKIAIIGSHGLYANYGGWDQLVINLAEKKNDDIEYLIFNSSDTSRDISIPEGVEVKWLPFKASGYQGVFYDLWSVLISYFKVDALLFLGAKAIVLIPILRVFKKKVVISNAGGVEWERPKFNTFIKKALRFTFNLSFKYSKHVVLDNEHYKIYLPKNVKSDIVKVIPYGGVIDTTLSINEKIKEKYPFIITEYYLSISRSLEDNQIEELCECFSKSNQRLVLISNLSNSEYGKKVYKRYKDIDNIIFINGLYNKPELDLIRRECKAYIHTHSLCGTAPSLVEMIIAQRPILSFDIPQNRFTLDNEGFFFSTFTELFDYIEEVNDLSINIPKQSLCDRYSWDKIVSDYESLY